MLRETGTFHFLQILMQVWQTMTIRFFLEPLSKSVNVLLLISYCLSFFPLLHLDHLVSSACKRREFRVFVQVRPAASEPRSEKVLQRISWGTTHLQAHVQIRSWNGRLGYFREVTHARVVRSRPLEDIRLLYSVRALEEYDRMSIRIKTEPSARYGSVVVILLQRNATTERVDWWQRR